MNEEQTHMSEDLKNIHLHLLVTIVSRKDGEKAAKVLQAQHCKSQFSIMAKGSRGSEILDILGLDSSDKSMVMCLTPSFRIPNLFAELSEALKLQKPGKGIAFSLPLSGVSMPLLMMVSGELREKIQNEINHKIDHEVNKMNSEITHALIIIVVNHGNGLDVIEVANEAGATGGTLVNASRTNTEEAATFFGIPVQAEKEIVAILTKKEKKHDIMRAVNDSFGLGSDSHGIIFSLPVDYVMGLKE